MCGIFGYQTGALSEGRRILPIPGGWQIVTYLRYRAFRGKIREQAAVGQQMAVEAIRTQDAPVAPPPSVTTAAPTETTTTTPGDFESAELGAVPTLAGVP